MRLFTVIGAAVVVLAGAIVIKELAITGGSGSYRRVAGDGTLLEHGDGTGTETLHLLGLRD